MNISACYIVKNEQNNIYDSLNSVKNIVTEIILVDTGSEDNTIQEVERFKNDSPELVVKLYHYAWDNHFANARNYSISQATQEYILIIDADEQLRGTIDDILLDYDVIFLKQKNYENKKLITELWTPRLFKNCGLQFKFRVHEQLEFEDKNLKVCKYDNLFLKHKEKNISQIKKKVKQLLELHYIQLQEEPDNPYILGQMAYCYNTLNNYEFAKHYALLCLLKNKLIPEQKAEMFNLLFEIDYNLGNINAIDWLKLSIESCSQQYRAYLLLREYFILINELKKAEQVKNDLLRIINNGESRLNFDVLINNINLN
jgi:glycosyltransferase involved in cell wall biosynthesis